MTMDKGEIVRSYRDAAKPKEQIKILADLNACGKEEIAQVLFEAGEIDQRTLGQYRRNAKSNPPAPDPVEAPEPEIAEKLRAEPFPAKAEIEKLFAEREQCRTRIGEIEQYLTELVELIEREVPFR